VSARQLLDQLLQSGQGLARDALSQGGGQGGAPRGAGGATAGASPAGGAGGLSSLLSGLGGGQGPSSLLGGLGGGALGAGALGLLMGSKKARKIGGKVAMYGGMAALGALAYRAYQDWQARQPGGQPGAPAPEPQTLDRLPAPQAEQHSRAVLAAMIGAAKADGHIGDSERALLEGELARLAGDPQDRAWLEAELARPLDPAQVAANAQTPEMAAEMYLASLMVVDEDSYMERAYLDELARRLNLTEDLKATLEAQARAG